LTETVYISGKIHPFQVNSTNTFIHLPAVDVGSASCPIDETSGVCSTAESAFLLFFHGSSCENKL
jgi:hypothetical protein